jgi:hypothetical protein
VSQNEARSRFEHKRLAYQNTFLGSNGRLLPHAEEVLADLRRASGMDREGLVISPVSKMVDSHATAYRAGQRDLFLRIVKFLELESFSSKETEHERPDTDG